MPRSQRTLLAGIDAVTADELRARGSFKWTAPGPGGFGAAVAEMDFGTAPEVVTAIERVTRDTLFGYLPDRLAGELALACADFQRRRFGWEVDPADIHPLPDVIKGLELAITRFSRGQAPIILPTPAYMPFLVMPRTLGREIIQVQMVDDGAGRFAYDLDGIDAAFRAGGNLLVLCNPHNPLGRVLTHEEMAALTEVVDRHGGRVFADEIHAPLVYPGGRHVPYASTSQTAAGHTLTATSASKGWNLPGLKCAQLIVSNNADRDAWNSLGPFPSHGASTMGVAANTAAFRDGEAWLAEVVAYLDESRQLLADLLAEELPDVRYRPPEGTYLAWLDCRAVAGTGSRAARVAERGRMLVIDGPACGLGGEGALRFNFATPQPVLAQMVRRMAAALRD